MKSEICVLGFVWNEFSYESSVVGFLILIDAFSDHMLATNFVKARFNLKMKYESTLIVLVFVYQMVQPILFFFDKEKSLEVSKKAVTE